MQNAQQPSYQKIQNASIVGGIGNFDYGGIETPTLEPIDENGDWRSATNRGPCGLKKRTFWIIVALSGVLLIGAVVGGVLAGTLTKKRSDADAAPTPITGDQMTTSSIPSPTTSPPATNSLGQPFPTSGITGIAANSCESAKGQNYTIRNQGFIPFCEIDFPGNSPAYSGGGTVRDIVRSIQYTFEDCMGFCVDFNNRLTDNNNRCLAVTYNANLTYSITTQGGNCFLKSARGVAFDTSLYYVASAVLII